MCGFVGAFNVGLAKEKLYSALKTLHHRGPDEMSVWQNREGDISFGHARLSIIDLKHGLQPLTNQDESLVAVVNGEFYDYGRIREELAREYKFKTSSDSEILLALYERYGTQCLKYLRGEFAFVLYDKRNRLIFAARDYFGIKPLFYTQKNNALYFASEAKALKDLGVSLHWDEDNFFQSLCMFPAPYASIFRGVQQIPPAHYLVKSEFSEAIHLQKYWDFNYPREHEQRKNVSEKEAIAGLHDAFKEAVDLRLKADVPVGCYLSGGLDSCSILGFASHFNKPIPAFTITFEDADYNEAMQAEEMAKMVGAPYYPLRITQREIAHEFENAIWHAERPIVNGHVVAKYLLSRSVREAGLKVVLTGEGSDEIFGGYVHFRQDIIEADNSLSAEQKEAMLATLRERNKVSHGFLMASRSDWLNLGAKRQLGFMPNWMRSFGINEELAVGLLSDEYQNKYQNRNHLSYVLNYLDLAGQVEGRDPLSKALYIWSRTMLPYYLLTVLGDRMEMAHSVEGRLPFLDHKVVEYVVNMPSALKIKGLTEKFALREAAKPYITKTIYERQKHPFLAPPSMLSDSKNPMANMIEDTLRSLELQKLGFVNPRAVIEVLDNFNSYDEERRHQYNGLLMALTSACLLQKRFEL